MKLLRKIGLSTVLPLFVGVFLVVPPALADVSITPGDANITEPTDVTTDLLTIDARDPNDGFSPITGLAYVPFSDPGCTSSLSDFHVTIKVRAQDETEYTLVDFKRNGEAGDYDPKYKLSIVDEGGCNFSARYIWDPSESQALGYYDIYAYVFDDNTGLSAEDLFTDVNNTDEVELTTDGLPGFPLDVPAITSVTVLPAAIDNEPPPGGNPTTTTITADFTDFDIHPASTFYVEMKVRLPDNDTERTIVAGVHGAGPYSANDAGSLAVTDLGLGSYRAEFLNWDPADYPAFSDYPHGPYDVRVYIRDTDGLSATSDFSANLDALISSADTSWSNNAPVINPANVLALTTPVIPGNTTTLRADFSDADIPAETTFTGKFFVRAQDNTTQFGPFDVPGASMGNLGGGNYRADYTWDTTGKPQGWYDLRFEVVDGNNEGVVSDFEDNRDELQVAPTIDITSVQVDATDYVIVDRQPQNNPPFFSTSTVITACFTDTWTTGAYYVTIKVREPDNSSVQILVPSQQSGGYGMTVTQDGCSVGEHQISYTWTPVATDPEGLYDIYVSVFDSPPGNTEVSDFVDNPDMVEVLDNPNNPPPPLNDPPGPGTVAGGTACVGDVGPDCLFAESKIVTMEMDFYDPDPNGPGQPEDVFQFTVSIRHPDGLQEWTLIDDQSNGSTTCLVNSPVSESCSLTVTDRGDGIYRMSFSWDPDDISGTGLFNPVDHPENLGWYDVKVVVKDGLGSGGESSFETNLSVLSIINSDFPPLPNEEPEITAVWSDTTPLQLDSADFTTLIATFTDEDNQSDRDFYTGEFRVRAPDDTDTLVSCELSGPFDIQNTDPNTFRATCDWKPPGTLSPGWYDLYFRVTDDGGTLADTTDDVSVISGFDDNEDEVELTAAANLAPNPPTALAQLKSDGITPVTLYTNEQTVIFQASMSDQNSVDDIYLEIEVEPNANLPLDGDAGTLPSDDPSIICFPDFPHPYTGTPVTGEVSCSSTFADGPYYWQARVRDVGEAISAWVPKGGTPDFIVDTVVPTVTSTDPVNTGDGDVTQNITVTFTDGPMDCSTIDTTTFYITPALANPSIVSCDATSAVLDPSTTVDLADGITYTVTLAAATVGDLATNLLNNGTDETWTFTARVFATTAGTATAVVATNTSIDVTMPYTFDYDADNTYTVEYKLNTAVTWTAWQNSVVSPFPNAASPFATTITGLTEGETYDVRATYNDADGVNGTNPQTILSIPLPIWSTTVGVATAVAGGNTTIDVSMPYTDDANTNNTYTVEYRLSTAVTWTAWQNSVVSPFPNTTSPFATTITGLTEGETYDVQVTYNDPVDGVNGTNPQTILSIPLPIWSTTVGVATAVVATNTSIDVSMPYTDDANTNNTYTVEYKLNTAVTWTAWNNSVVSPFPNTASPFTTTITGLTEGETYDVQVTYNDPVDGVNGTNPQTIGGIGLPIWSTTAGVATAVPASNTTIDVTMPYTDDVNTNNTYTVEYRLNTAVTWTNWVTGAAHVASPYTTTITGLTPGEAYDVQVTYNDPVDGVNGTNPQTIIGIPLANDGTVVGTATAVPATNTTIDVSMPYTSDDNTNNTYTVEYKLNTAVTWTAWNNSVVSPFPNAASPFTTTITGLTEGETYDVRATYNDADGVSGTNPQTILSIPLPIWSTTTGSASAVVATNTSIDVSMPYTDDANTNNTYTVEYKLNTAVTWTAWNNSVVSPFPNAASPFTTTITGLTEGETYDVQVTYNDPVDGVNGTNPQTILSIPLPIWSTTVGTATAVVATNTSIDVSMPYTDDANTNNTYTVEYKLNTAVTWTNWITGAANTASPYTTTITGLTEGESYDVKVTYNDPVDGVNGTNPQTILSIPLPIWSTTVGAATAVAASNTTIDVSMPYTDDVNTNNTYTVEYRLNTAVTWTNWVTGAAHVASPYTTTIIGLTPGESYDVRVTYNDPVDGVNGTNPQTILSIPLPADGTSAGTATAVVATNTSIDVSMPYTGDDNTNNTYTVEYKLATAGSWTNWITGAAHVASPYTTTITGLTEGETYDVRVTYNDIDGVTGTNPQTISNITLPDNRTTADVATAVAVSNNDIDVTMPYTNDNNSNNTYTVEYKLSTDVAWTNWVTAAPHVASPFTTTITGLTAGDTYDVRVTYNDADGVNGANPQTIAGILMPITDLTAPDYTSDLAITKNYERGLLLLWTAPNDNAGNTNSGGAFRYDIRFQDAVEYPTTMTDSTVWDTNWNNATFWGGDDLRSAAYKPVPSQYADGTVKDYYTLSCQRPYTRLSAGIDNTVTTIPVVSTDGFPFPTKIKIDDEVLDCTGSITATTFTGCARGANDADSNPTVAAAHSADATVIIEPDKCVEAATTDDRILPNTVYYTSLMSKDERDATEVCDGASQNCTLASNVPDYQTPANSGHPQTAMKYGYNMITMSYDWNSDGTGIKTLENIFGDDIGLASTYLRVYRWNSNGEGQTNGSWALVPNATLLGSMTNGQGYYLYSYGYYNVLDNMDSGDVALLNENANGYEIVALEPGWNLIGNPYMKNVDLADTYICTSSGGTVTGFNTGSSVCTGTGTITTKTYANAVADVHASANGWVGSDISFFVNRSSLSSENYATAKLRPWWGVWLEVFNDPWTDATDGANKAAPSDPDNQVVLVIVRPAP